jgi:hypothetical protein
MFAKSEVISRIVRRASTLRYWPSLLAMLLAAISIQGRTRADLLYFEKGGAVQAPASIEGDEVLVTLPDAQYSFHRKDFRKIVPGFSPRQEWKDRQSRGASLAPSARFEKAWWALENGLTAECAAELRSLHRLEPARQPVGRMVAILDELDRPVEDPSTADFQKSLGVAVSVARGPHILLFHQRSDEEAQSRIAFLEQVIPAYYLFFAAQGIDLKVPRSRLVFAWFNEKNDYVAFLRSQNASPFLTTRGYFHPTWNAVVTYDARDSDVQREGRETTRVRREQLAGYREGLKRLPARARLRISLADERPRNLSHAEALAFLDRLEGEIRRDEFLLDLERRAIDEGTAAHELIHLLAANSGLQPRHDAFPIWLQEGLAMQFEVVRGGWWSGIGRAHDLRLPDWRRVASTARLEPLIGDVGWGRGYQRDLYAQAWSLVCFLRSEHPREFLRYLDLLRGPDASLAELPRAERSRSAFQRAFGTDLGTLDRQWHDAMNAMKTPLESHAPPSDNASTAKSSPRSRSSSR